MRQVLILLVAAMAAAGRVHSAAPAKPNIVFILADDIGYGDVGCYGAQRVKTPNIDRLAREGLRFTDAHAPASVCTPTRFAFLTGQYAWRVPGTGIAPGNARLLIPPTTPTVASLLKRAGYRTALVGKWHLGLGVTEPDFNGELKPGPLELGFDSAFFIPATGDRVPCVWVEDHRVVGLDPADPITISFRAPIPGVPTARSHPEQLIIKAGPGHYDSIIRGISRKGFMKGGTKAHWRDEEIADTLARRAVAFLEKQRAGSPFFLYLATHDIHEPMVPHPRFRGTSDCGWRGDVIHQLDWTVGEVLGALDRLALARETLVIFTSDNGGALKDTYDDGTNALHGRQPPNGILRGQKSTLYEGGHRVPFIARWPDRIPPATESAALIAHVDMFSSFAALVGQKIPEGAAPDSVNLLPALLGETDAQGRDELVLQNNGQAPLALRSGAWKLVQRPGRDAELYHLGRDLSETTDLASAEPERVRSLISRLTAIRDETSRGRIR